MILLTRKVCAGVPAAAVLCVIAFAPQSLAQIPGPISVGGAPNNPPILVSLEAQQLPGKKFRITGRVADETPASCSVVISGVASGSASCDSGGNFSLTVSVPTLGQIKAVASDGTLSSDPAYKTLANAAPTITGFMAVGGPDNTWTFSGTVNDEAPEGLTVSLSGPTGVQGASATCTAGGSFSVTLTLAPGTGGFVTATVADWYGATGQGFTSFGS